MVEKVESWVRKSPTFKIFAVLIITLLLLIPASEIESLIYERSILQEDVIRELSSKWGQPQTFTGPILSVPYSARANVDTKNEKVEIRYLHLLPEYLNVKTDLDPSVKKRSIYKAILYSANIAFEGNFDLTALFQQGIDAADIELSKATLSLGISDTRGINKISEVAWGDDTLEIEPGLPAWYNYKTAYMENCET